MPQNHPDISMLDKGNLCFLQTGKLVLLDTNALRQHNPIAVESQFSNAKRLAKAGQKNHGILGVVHDLRAYAAEAKVGKHVGNN